MLLLLYNYGSARGIDTIYGDGVVDSDVGNLEFADIDFRCFHWLICGGRRWKRVSY